MNDFIENLETLIISPQYARKILTENKIILDPCEPRSSTVYVTELLIWIEAVNERFERDSKAMQYSSAQSETPYFA